MENNVAKIKRPSPEFPRRMLPPDLDLGDWERIEPFFNQLLSRQIETPAELEAWLLDISELSAAVEEEGARRYIAMTVATDDEAAGRAYLEFVQTVEPKLALAGRDLDQKLVSCPHLAGLDQQRYGVLMRDTRSHLEIFRDENVPLKTRLKELAQEYQSIQGAMTVEFEGRERTMQEMSVYLHQTDRGLRRRSWEAAAARRQRDAGQLDELFAGMLGLRQTVAENAGFKNYIPFRFKELGRFDYTPSDCLEFHQTVERAVVPLYRDLLASRKGQLGVTALKPYDLAVDTKGRAPLKPFEKAAELSQGVERIFSQLDGELGRFFTLMKAEGLLDLSSRKGKAPGGYQTSLDEVRLPFIFMNAVGVNQDVFTLLHEGGHAFHAMLCRREPLADYRHAPMEFSEVASMGMELMAMPYLGEFYGPAQAARAARDNLESVLWLFPWVATIDAFQHWLYTHPGHGREERTHYWLGLVERFGGGVDWFGYEDYQASSWQRQLHLFEVPFYYIEYAIAQLGALQLWRLARQDPGRAVAGYKAALSLGGCRPLDELFAAAGLEFGFGERLIAPLLEEVRIEIDRLAGLEETE